MGPTIQFKTSVGKAFDIVTCGLRKRGFRVVRSFDFQEAASAHPHCRCPFHKTADCTCQYLMLIAYHDDVEDSMFTIALHSDDAKTFVSLIEGDESEWINVMVPLAAETT
jgi:hypothetical protein